MKLLGGGGGGGSYGGGAGGGGGGSYGGGAGATGNLAVISHQNVRYVDVPTTGHTQPTNLNIDSRSSPINLNFQSFSSPVNLNHNHQAARGSFRQTQSQDEPHVRVHTVTKPSKS